MDRTRPTDGIEETAGFEASSERFATLVGWLGGKEARALSHGELEARLQVESRALFCGLFQDHLDLRELREARLGGVADADGVPRGAVEAAHERRLTTVFGEVTVGRLAYRRKGTLNLHPDAALNLPEERHSHGLREMAAVESSRGSFDDAGDAIWARTGQRVGKRQVEGLSRSAAVDFESFYANRPRRPSTASDALVVSVDGKGIVMRPDALRPATAEAAARSGNKLEARLSKGEKRNTEADGRDRGRLRRGPGPARSRRRPGPP